MKNLLFVFNILTDAAFNTYTCRPLTFQIPVARAIAPWLPLKLRRFLAKIVPFGTLRQLLHIVGIMDKNAREVLRSKRNAIEKGQEVIQQQIAAGKDLMSILCARFCTLVRRQLALTNF